MPDRWTQATEQLVADELRGLVGMQFTDSDADNRAEQILQALADAGLLVEPPQSTDDPWKPGDRCATCLSEDTYLNDDGHASCRGCGRSDDDDD